MHFPFPQRVEVPHGNGKTQNASKRLFISTDMKARAIVRTAGTSGTHCTWYFHLRRSGSRYGALVPNCAVGIISSRRSERRTQQRLEDAPCLADITSTLLCVCGYTSCSERRFIFDKTGALSPFNNELKYLMAMATQPKGWPPT
jgi:hypothetical protein